MSLPTVIVPEYTVQLISLKKPVRYRPYLVKEEKLLLMAQQGDDAAEVRQAVEQIVRNCTFDEIAVSKLPSFDLEFLFLQLRARSVNNLIELEFVCRNKVAGTTGEDVRCGAHVPISINIDDIKMTVPEGHTNKIWLSDDLGVTLRYPTLDVADAITTNASFVNILGQCLDTVFKKDGSVFEINEQPPEEIATFVESLGIPQVEKIRTFFDTLPRLEHTFTFKCPKCEYEEEYTLSGLQDFFG